MPAVIRVLKVLLALLFLAPPGDLVAGDPKTENKSAEQHESATPSREVGTRLDELYAAALKDSGKLLASGTVTKSAWTLFKFSGDAEADTVAKYLTTRRVAASFANEVAPKIARALRTRGAGGVLIAISAAGAVMTLFGGSNMERVMKKQPGAIKELPLSANLLRPPTPHPSAGQKEPSGYGRTTD